MGFRQDTTKEEFLREVARCWLQVKKRANVILKETDCDLTFEQLMVLFILNGNEGQNISQIAERADRERTTISRMIDGLEKRNLVVRIPDKIDGRQKILYLTKLGKNRIDQLAPQQEAFHNIIYHNVRPAELNAALGILKRIADNLEIE